MSAMLARIRHVCPHAFHSRGSTHTLCPYWCNAVVEVEQKQKPRQYSNLAHHKILQRKEAWHGNANHIRVWRPCTPEFQQRVTKARTIPRISSASSSWLHLIAYGTKYSCTEGGRRVGATSHPRHHGSDNPRNHEASTRDSEGLPERRAWPQTRRMCHPLTRGCHSNVILKKPRHEGIPSSHEWVWHGQARVEDYRFGSLSQRWMWFLHATPKKWDVLGRWNPFRRHCSKLHLCKIHKFGVDYRDHECPTGTPIISCRHTPITFEHHNIFVQCVNPQKNEKTWTESRGKN